MKDESFMQNVNWIYSLKLRVSYGTVGNTAISPYQQITRLCIIILYITIQFIIE